MIFEEKQDETEKDFTVTAIKLYVKVSIRVIKSAVNILLTNPAAGWWWRDLSINAPRSSVS